MSYTWEETILGIDLKHEMDEKRRKQEDIEAKAAEEQDWMSAWGLGLSILGGMAFGPAGMFIGKQFGKWGADLGLLPWTADASGWEDMKMDEGKFFSEKARDFNKDLKEKAKDVDQAQLVDSIIDLGTMWIQAGGLQEGFDPTIGGGDWTTFGTGDAAWSVFGREGDPFTGSSWASEGAGGMVHPVTGKAIGSAPMPTGTPGIPGLFSSDQPGFMNALQAGGKRLSSAWQQEALVDQVATAPRKLDTMYQEYLERG